MPLSAIISVTAALLALAAWRYRSTILRIRLAPTLFSGARQDWTFSHIAEIFPTVEIPAATRRTPFPEAAFQDLPETFEFEGQSFDTDTFLEDTDTAAMLVLKTARSSTRPMPAQVDAHRTGCPGRSPRASFRPWWGSPLKMVTSTPFTIW